MGDQLERRWTGRWAEKHRRRADPRARAAGRPSTGRRGDPRGRDGGPDGSVRGRDLHRQPNGPAGTGGLAEARPWTNRHATDSRTGNIGRYAVASEGTLTALGSTPIENDPTSSPHEEGVSAGQNYLYVLAQGLSQIVGYRVGADGSLTQVTAVPVATGSFGVGAN